MNVSAIYMIRYRAYPVAAFLSVLSIGCARVTFSSSGVPAMKPAVLAEKGEAQAVTDEVFALSDGATLEVDHKNKAAYIKATIRSAHLELTPSLTFLGEMPYSPDIAKSCVEMAKTVSRGSTVYQHLISHRAGYYYLRVEDKADFQQQARALLASKGWHYTIFRKPTQFSAQSLVVPSLMSAGVRAPRGLKILLSVLGNGSADQVAFGLTIGELCDLISPQTVLGMDNQSESLSISLGF